MPPAPKEAPAIQCNHCKRWHHVHDTTYIAFFGDVYVGGAGDHAIPLLETEQGEPIAHYFCRDVHCIMSVFDGVLDMMLTRREVKPKLSDEEKEARKNETEEEKKARKEEEKKIPRQFIDTITLYSRGYDRTPRHLLVALRQAAAESITEQGASAVFSDDGDEPSDNNE
jgi:hypothetical protein